VSKSVSVDRLTCNPVKAVKPVGRSLQCGVEIAVKKYNAVLKELIVCHRASDKLELLYTDQDTISPADFQLLFNNGIAR